MKYEKSERVQETTYSPIDEFVYDLVETLNDEEYCNDAVNVIAGKEVMTDLIDTINSKILKDFEFDMDDLKPSEIKSDILNLSVFSDGEAYLESAIDSNGRFYDCESFIYLHNEIDREALMYENRKCDAIVFGIE